jgi:Rrf2 family iron-sulfur cluster assembly transcriptional regulator
MIYSTSAKYAVMAMIDLAACSDDDPKLIKDISASTGIPHPFLAKLVQLLVKAGVLNSIKGRGGGLRFTRSPSEIPLAEVVRAVDGQQALQNCIFGLQLCDGTRNCPIHPLWGPIRDQILNFLETTTIADLADKIKPVQKNYWRSHE